MVPLEKKGEERDIGKDGDNQKDLQQGCLASRRVILHSEMASMLFPFSALTLLVGR